MSCENLHPLVPASQLDVMVVPQQVLGIRGGLMVSRTEQVGILRSNRIAKHVADGLNICRLHALILCDANGCR